jgi:threonine/homoserine/homoserine lactone efflux protein
MTTSTKPHSDLFYGALAAIAMIGPTSLVIAAATMSEIPATGQFMVYGHGIILAVLASALVLRVAYIWGYSQAFKVLAREPKFPAIA